jgi:hypothetical protein
VAQHDSEMTGNDKATQLRPQEKQSRMWIKLDESLVKMDEFSTSSSQVENDKMKWQGTTKLHNYANGMNRAWMILDETLIEPWWKQVDETW